MYEELLRTLAKKPELYEPGEKKFWDDDHISAQMLAAHLNPAIDAASRKPDFIDRAVSWIVRNTRAIGGRTLLDLGCGPGLYDMRFARAGLDVTGIDISRRSINYAKDAASEAGLRIQFELGSYLEMQYEAQFDAALCEYYDFGVLCPSDRAEFLRRARRALRPGGILMLDALGPGRESAYKEGVETEYCERGFWSADPHAVIERRYLYAQTHNTVESYIVLSECGMKVYNTWNQIFTGESLTEELLSAGFTKVELYGDMTGAPYTAEGETLCALARI